MSRRTPYQPLKQTSDSLEQERVTNPQVQLPSPAIWNPPLTSRTPPQPLHSTARPTSLNYPIANTAQTLHSTASRTGPLYSTAPSTPPPFDPAARPIIIQPVVQTELILIVKMSFGRTPVRMQCPNCNIEQMTRTELKLGRANWVYCEMIVITLFILSLVLVFPLLLLPFALIVLCNPNLNDVEHSCPNCNFILGRFEQYSETSVVH